MVTYGMTALIVGGLIAVLYILAVKILAVKDKRTRKTMGWIGAILLIPGLIAVVAPGTIPFLDQPIDFGEKTVVTYTPPTGGPQAGGIICAVEDTTVTLSAVDKYTSGASGGTHRYRVNGNPALTVSDAGTLTASPGDILEILFQNGSAGSNYFSVLQTQNVPCSGTITFSAEVVQNGSLTIELFNEEGNLISAPENETLGAGDVVTLSGKLKGTYQRGFPYGGIIVAEFNNSDFDDIVVNAGGEKVNTPNFYTVGNVANVVKAYSVPAIESNQILEFTVMIDVDATNNPGDANDPTLKFYPNNYYINEDTGGSFDGPSAGDEKDLAVTPGHLTTFTVSVD